MVYIFLFNNVGLMLRGRLNRKKSHVRKLLFFLINVTLHEELQVLKVWSVWISKYMQCYVSLKKYKKKIKKGY